MKQIIFIISIFICSLVKGQTDTTYRIFYCDTCKLTISGSLLIEPKIEYDTLPCIMLVCDTSIQGRGMFAARNPQVWWQFGYAVTKKEGGFYYTKLSIEYIDDRKRPLPKNIVVWMTINNLH